MDQLAIHESPRMGAAPPQPNTIFVVGMHRSGTSVLAHVINLMGAFVGGKRELIPPHPSVNPTGFWERADIVSEHDRLLRNNGFAWGTVANFSLDRIGRDQRAEFIDRLRVIVGGMAKSGPALVIKDPRLCLMLPLWHEFVGAPIHVVSVRDPRKIAASLMAAFPDSFTTDFLLALWQKYMQSALAALAGKRALFVSYARLLEEPEAELRRLWRGLGELGADGLSGFDLGLLRSALDAGLDRSEPSPRSRPDEDQRQLFSWLERRCETAGPVEVRDMPDISPPDTILHELEGVRRACMRNGWNMAVKDGAKNARSAMTQMV